MHTVVDSSVMSDMQTNADLESGLPATVITSLYDLMAAMQATTPPEEDNLVVATVMHLLRCGRLTFVRRRAIPFSPRQMDTTQPYTATAGTAA